MKNRLLILILVLALTMTGMAMPVAAYGAEADTAQAAAEESGDGAAVETAGGEGQTEASMSEEEIAGPAEEDSAVVGEDSTPDEDGAVAEEADAAAEETEEEPETAVLQAASEDEVVLMSAAPVTLASANAVTSTGVASSAAITNGKASKSPATVLKKTTLRGALAKSKRSATLSWKRVSKADGYKIYRYIPGNKKYKLVKTVKGANKLSSTVTPTLGVVNYYKIRAYRSEGGKTIYSDYSEKVKFDLRGYDEFSLTFKSKTPSVSGSRTGNTKGVLRWGKVTGASGYSIYKYSKSKKKYIHVKDVKGANALSTTVSLAANKSTSYKVRAYRDYKGKRIRTGYSSAKKYSKVPKGQRVVSTGKSKIGCSYVYGASGPNVFDCSGFTMYVMRQHGVYLPHNAAGQYYALRSKNIGTNWHNAKAGDLVFYSYGGAGSSHHVGIYVGNGKVMHASSTHGRVVVTRIGYTNGHVAAICRP